MLRKGSTGTAVTAQRRFLDWGALTGEAQHTVAATASERARRLEPILNAFVSIEDPSVDPLRAGALARVPYAAKDLFVTPAHRPTGGLADIMDFGLDGDAEVLRRLDEAGACRIGFTALTELAYEPSGYNAVRACPNNPWNPDFIPGGSSSGSAVAVASGTAVIALGSDTGGSLRIPAHCSGVTAWKPTYGAVSVVGVLPLAPFLDVIGLLARGAADMVPAAVALAANGLRDVSSPIERVVVLKDTLDAAEPSVCRACQQGIDAVAACGVSVAHVAGLAAIEAIDVHALIVMQAEAARVHASRLDHPSISPVLRKRLSKGLAIDDATLLASRAVRSQLARDFVEQVLGNADAAILPVMPIRTPPAAETNPTSPSFAARQLYELSHCCRFVNMLGFPAVAIPTGFDDRALPVALQIIGRPGHDLDLLALAARVQQTTDWHARVPNAIAGMIGNIEGALA
jgi:aspartyl-tRNA(Asn)/glutamyl-tRNA(Gln) amidotransferase subunit A